MRQTIPSVIALLAGLYSFAADSEELAVSHPLLGKELRFTRSHAHPFLAEYERGFTDLESTFQLPMNFGGRTHINLFACSFAGRKALRTIDRWYQCVIDLEELLPLDTLFHQNTVYIGEDLRPNKYRAAHEVEWNYEVSGNILIKIPAQEFEESCTFIGVIDGRSSQLEFRDSQDVVLEDTGYKHDTDGLLQTCK